MIPGDRVLEISTANRHNMDVVALEKSETGKGEVERMVLDSHKRDFSVF